jgi:hypothetical protein
MVKGARAKDLEQAPASPKGWSRCFGPLDAECGRDKLRASREDSLRAAEACKALPRAGFEALCQRPCYPTRRGYLVIFGIRDGTTGTGAAEFIGSK